MSAPADPVVQSPAAKSSTAAHIAKFCKLLREKKKINKKEVQWWLDNQPESCNVGLMLHRMSNGETVLTAIEKENRKVVPESLLFFFFFFPFYDESIVFTPC